MFMRHAAKLESLPDSGALWEAALSVFAAEGLTHVIYLVSDAGRRDVALRTNVPEIYRHADPGRDPFLDYCCKTYDITWTGAAHLPDYDYLPDPAQRLILSARDVGFISGLGIPTCVDRSDRFGGFNLGSRLDAAAFEARYRPHVGDIQSLCFVVQRRLDELSRREDAATDALSPRERETILMIADGLTRKECAQSLGLSPNTVADYTKSAYRKLGVSNRVQAARLILK
jgi:DNA-binding CsgD family transcriptional regulator